MKQHPGENILSLYACGELDWNERLHVALHVHGCADCRKHVENHQALRGDLASLQAEPVRSGAIADPMGDWDGLSEEMTANIRLGISAAECVGATRKGRRFAGFFWSPGLMAACASVLLAGAFLLNMPLERIERVWHNVLSRGIDQTGLVLESTALGIEMRRDGRSLINFPHPDRTSHDVAANLDGSMSAGYVDDETGQVTIIHVAGE